MNDKRKRKNARCSCIKIRQEESEKSDSQPPVWFLRLRLTPKLSMTDPSVRETNLLYCSFTPTVRWQKKPVEGDWPKTVKLTPGTATGHFNTRLFNADVSQLSVNWPLITNGFMCLIRQVWDRIHRCGPILITFCPPHSCMSEPIPLSPFAVQVLEKIYRHRTDEKHAKIEKMAFKNA